MDDNLETTFKSSEKHAIKTWEEPFEVGPTKTAAHNGAKLNEAIQWWRNSPDRVVSNNPVTGKILLPAGRMSYDTTLDFWAPGHMVGTSPVRNNGWTGTELLFTGQGNGLQTHEWNSQDQWDHWFCIENIWFTCENAQAAGTAGIAIQSPGEVSCVRRCYVGADDKWDYGIFMRSAAGYTPATGFIERCSVFKSAVSALRIENLIGGGSGSVWVDGLSGDDNKTFIHLIHMNAVWCKGLKCEDQNDPAIIIEDCTGMVKLQGLFNTAQAGPQTDFIEVRSAANDPPNIDMNCTIFNYANIINYVDEGFTIPATNSTDRHYNKIYFGGMGTSEGKDHGAVMYFAGRHPGFKITPEDEHLSNGVGIGAHNADPDGVVQRRRGSWFWRSDNQRWAYKKTGNYDSDTTWVTTLHEGTESLTLGAAATTFAAAHKVVLLTGDGGTNSVTTITGGDDGCELTIIFQDGNVTLVDDDTPGTDTINLAGAASDFTGTQYDSIKLVHDGTSWTEVSRSVN